MSRWPGRSLHSLFGGGSSHVTFYYCLFIHCPFVVDLLIVGCLHFSHHFRYQDNLNLAVIYRSPNSPPENHDYLRNLIQEANNLKSSHLLIMGDFNYNDINWRTETTPADVNHTSTKFMECLRDCFLYQRPDTLPRKPDTKHTRSTHHKWRGYDWKYWVERTNRQESPRLYSLRVQLLYRYIPESPAQIYLPQRKIPDYEGHGNKFKLENIPRLLEK